MVEGKLMTRYTAVDFRCPHCSARPHAGCTYKTGDEKRSFHRERLLLAKASRRRRDQESSVGTLDG